ncbi:hypothetical protein SADUNF_Sadunf16G0086800 [Salix dunnii]|uniref:Uncharacterized protein n=1 Tax=Salix dunnii TaxID=1413687 RepID=A0A835J8N6_9ROSI|nr:hypothetical protein SADUNF_Sadunf16G0086800 [Salix dunnii]
MLTISCVQATLEVDLHCGGDGFTRPPVNKAHVEGITRGQPVDRRRNPTPRIQYDSEEDSDEGDDMGYGLPPYARRPRE